jgi:S-adenosylmethionine synthetase
VIGVGSTRAKGDIIRCDLNDFDAITKLVGSLKPQVIVHCAAERRLENVQRDPVASRRLNVDVPRLLAQLCKQHFCWLLLISTDYVFDGKNPPYSTSAPTHPLNEYGVQKRDAELAATEADWGTGVLRVPLLYGAVQSLDESNVSSMVENLLCKTPIAYDNVQVRFPTLVDDVAFVARRLSEQKMDHCGLSGIWHWSGNEAMTKYGIAVRLGTILGLDHSHVTPVNVEDAGSLQRPHNAQLDVSTLTLMGISQITPFEQGVRNSFASWVSK